MEFETESLFIRKVERSEQDMLMQLLTSEGADRFFSRHDIDLQAYSNTFIKGKRRSKKQRASRFRRGYNQGYGVFEKSSGKMVGIIRFNFFAETGRVLIGRMIHPDFRRRGFASQLDIPIMRFIRDKHGIDEFSMYVKSDNVASNQRVQKNSVFELVETVDTGIVGPGTTETIKINRYDYALSE